MSARDELAQIIASNLDRIFGTRDFGPATQDCKLADALIAAGYVKHRTITTIEELDALGFQAVVRDAEDYVLERWGEPEEGMWATPMNGAWIRSAEITLPATVLHEGAQP